MSKGEGGGELWLLIKVLEKWNIAIENWGGGAVSVKWKGTFLFFRSKLWRQFKGKFQQPLTGLKFFTFIRYYFVLCYASARVPFSTILETKCWKSFLSIFPFRLFFVRRLRVVLIYFNFKYLHFLRYRFLHFIFLFVIVIYFCIM